MMKIAISLLIVAVLAYGETCNKLLNCKTCLDSTHCKDCLAGYILDANKVCRYDCKKYGSNCTSCTDKKCICSFGYEWDVAKNKCVQTDCGSNEVCNICGKSYDVIDVNGQCSTCKLTYGEGCVTCNSSRCLTVGDGYKLLGAIAVLQDCDALDLCPGECSDLFPGCSSCSYINGTNSTENATSSKCLSCASGKLVDGFCVYQIPRCPSPNKTIFLNGKLDCIPCTTFDSNCIPSRCNAHGCSLCRTGFAVDPKGGCVNCSKAFTGCGLCVSDACTKCGSSSWVLTPNGCFNQNPYVDPKKSDAGTIAAIVVACFVFVVLVVLAIYCLVTGSRKKGEVDPSIYEADFEFKSQSML